MQPTQEYPSKVLIHGGYNAGDDFANGVIGDPFWSSMTDDGRYLAVASTSSTGGYVHVFSCDQNGEWSLIRTLLTGSYSLALACDIRPGTPKMLYRDRAPNIIEHDLETGADTVLFAASSNTQVALYHPSNRNRIVLGTAGGKDVSIVERNGTVVKSATLLKTMRSGSVYWNDSGRGEGHIIASNGQSNGFSIYNPSDGTIIASLTGVGIPAHVYARQNMLFMTFENHPTLMVDSLVPIPYYDLGSPANSVTVRWNSKINQWEFISTYGYAVTVTPESTVQRQASMSWRYGHQETVSLAPGGTSIWTVLVPSSRKGLISVNANVAVDVKFCNPKFHKIGEYATIFPATNTGGIPTRFPTQQFTGVQNQNIEVPGGMQVGILEVKNSGAVYAEVTMTTQYN
ncbi:hypothetical protein Q9251_03035 [Alkalihalobacillus macyae]|uniref:hypothetical protein n=1 Tax=Guptibacillus hwajinpoensis TaxID=208199 RepID=UPI00273C3845|nr:hypothetical protein [Alkalihalobacillus macyae]MDP4549850.1 hypothetical protein [Alkalihalobacillus macyae]